MLHRLVIRNLKTFEEVDLELGSTVVFIGPNSSGKTTALQALALWELGLKRWQEKHGGGTPPRKRSAVTINRRDLVALPVPATKLLWRVRARRAPSSRPRTWSATGASWRSAWPIGCPGGVSQSRGRMVARDEGDR